MPDLVTSMLGNRLITKQTPPEGIPVSKVMVAEAIDITRETYFCILMDRESNGPVIVASVSVSLNSFMYFRRRTKLNCKQEYTVYKFLLAKIIFSYLVSNNLLKLPIYAA